MEWWIWPLAFSVAAAWTAATYWLYRQVALWLINVGERPQETAEPGTVAHDIEQLNIAIHEFHVVVVAAIRPRLERMASWLRRILR